LGWAEAVGEAHEKDAHSWDTAQERGIVPKPKGTAAHVLQDFSREEPGLP